MIIKGSSLKVIDNSGAKWSKCIKVVGKSLVGNTGSLILVTLSNFINRKKVKKRTIYLGLIAGVKFWVHRPDGSFFRFLLDKLITNHAGYFSQLQVIWSLYSKFQNSNLGGNHPYVDVPITRLRWL